MTEDIYESYIGRLVEVQLDPNEYATYIGRLSRSDNNAIELKPAVYTVLSLSNPDSDRRTALKTVLLLEKEKSIEELIHNNPSVQLTSYAARVLGKGNSAMSPIEQALEEEVRGWV